MKRSMGGFTNTALRLENDFTRQDRQKPLTTTGSYPMTRQKKIAKAQEAFQAVLDAEAAFRVALVAAFPVGAHAYYEHGTNSVGCRVTRHFYGHIQVVGDKSGKEYQIHGARLLP